jgi:hypothetical protein
LKSPLLEQHFVLEIGQYGSKQIQELILDLKEHFRKVHKKVAPKIFFLGLGFFGTKKFFRNIFGALFPQCSFRSEISVKS